MAGPETLPDLLAPGLDLVFVGINPGERSAELGHYYAHRGNGFWSALSDSPLVARRLGPGDDGSLPASERIGFTDIVKRVVTDSTRISTAELRAAEPAFRARIAAVAPRAVCLTSGRAFDVLFPRLRPAGSWGRQQAALDQASLWVMPSTSGRAAGYRPHVHRVLAELASFLGRGSAPPP